MNNKKQFNMTDFYYPVNYHIGEEENVFNNPEKFGFIEVAIVRSGDMTITTMQKEAIEYFIVGYTGLPKQLFGYDKIDKTVVRIPNTENLVVVYNKYYEADIRNHTDVNKHKPAIHIPEVLTIYSSCAVCRINENNELISIEPSDCPKFEQYLSNNN